MTRSELENNKNLFVSEYDDITLYAETLHINSKVWSMNKEENVAEEMRVVSCIYRSEDVEKYDEMSVEDFFAAYEENYDVTAEFVTDSDCIYVYLEKIERNPTMSSASW